MSGLGGRLGRRLRLGPLHGLGVRPAQIPGDEVTQELGTATLANQVTQLFPVVIGNADHAVGRVGVLRSADHAHRVGAAYAACPLSRLTMHMHTGKVLHMHNPELDGINSCRHKDYFMTCEQFEELLTRSASRCEICHRTGVETSHGQLYIDHDKWRGMWAVRGLLCGRCNSMLEHEEHFTPGVRQYLDQSWFKGMLAAAGVEEAPSEPPIGSTVHAGQACNWHRSNGGWRCSCGRHRRTRIQPKAWAEILRSVGPHRMRITRY